MKKNSNSESYPKITIDLPPLQEAFLRFYFEVPEKKSEILINRRYVIGKVINALFQNVNVKIKGPSFSNPVTVVLPVTSNNHYVLQSRHIFLPSWANEKIKDAISSEYQLWIKKMFAEGEELRYSQKDIIESILNVLNVRNNVANFEAIKKYDYRNRAKNINKRSKQLLTHYKSKVY